MTGIWHGANWTFLCWGLWYFLLLIFEKRTGFAEKIGKLSHIYALAAIIFGWVIFRSASIGQAIQYMGMMLGFGSIGLVDSNFTYYLSGSWVVFVYAVLLSVPVAPRIINKIDEFVWGRNVEVLFGTVVFLLSVLRCISSSYNPFIYFNF